MKFRAKKWLFFLLGCITLLFMSACRPSDQASSLAVFSDYQKALTSHNFDEAYALLSSETQQTLTRENFVYRYQDLINKLGDDTVFEFSNIETDETPSIYHIIHYDLTYLSPKYGEISRQFSMHMVQDGNEWRIHWSPSQIFPEMTWADRLRITTRYPKRGEIFASGELVAGNAPGQTVYAIPSLIKSREQFAIDIAPYLGMQSKDILKKLMGATLMGSVNVSALNVRATPSLAEDSEVLLMLNQGESVEILDGGITVSSIENLSTEDTPAVVGAIDPTMSTHDNDQLVNRFYKVRCKNGDSTIDGYAFAPYLSLYSSMDTVFLKSFSPDSLPQATQLLIENIPGAGVDTSSLSEYRIYPRGESFFHLVGYVAETTGAQLKDIENRKRQDMDPLLARVGYAAFESIYDSLWVPQDEQSATLDEMYPSGKIIGQTGLEKQYEMDLRGKNGYEIYLSAADGSQKRSLIRKDAENGLDLHLSIDPNLQQYAYDMLRLYLFGSQSGTIVTTDPTTGAVTALVSYPSVNPNDFDKMTPSEWAYINTKAPNNPLLNRAIQGRYVPGSVFKPFTAAAAMNAGVLTTNSVFPYEKDIAEDKWMPKRSDWFGYPAIKRVENAGDSNRVNFYNSMTHSDNIYFAWAAMELGIDPFLEYCHDQLGFEENIPFDLPVRKSSVFRADPNATDLDDATSDNVFHIKYLADSGYGQGKMLMTPLHVAMLYGAIAEDGEILQPYVVSRITHDDGLDMAVDFEQRKTVWKPSIAKSDSILDDINRSLRNVMVEGTGKKIVSPFRTAGKSGTAERDKKNDISWFAAYKATNPRNFLAIVAIECKTNQGGSRSPIISSLLAYYDNKSKEKPYEAVSNHRFDDEPTETIDDIPLDDAILEE